MKKKVMYYSTLHCKECNLLMVIPRPVSHKRPEGHIKTMYCAVCKKETDFIETYKEKTYI